MRTKTKALLTELAAWCALIALVSVAGHFGYEDEVLQGQSNCANATYAYDNPQFCKGE